MQVFAQANDTIFDFEISWFWDFLQQSLHISTVFPDKKQDILPIKFADGNLRALFDFRLKEIMKILLNSSIKKNKKNYFFLLESSLEISIFNK